MYKLSVIIPVYNAENNLERCLKSVLLNLTDNIEVVIINDGSTDNSAGIIERYKKMYSNQINYIEKENTGVADTRNLGISKASGEYILFIDSDDYIKQGLFEKLEDYMKKEIDIIKFKAVCVDENDNEIKKIDGPIFDVLNGQDGFNELVFCDNLIDSPCLYILKKELFTKNNMKFVVGTEHEDFGLIPLLLITAKTMVSTNIYGYYYVQTCNSITRNNEYQKTLKKFNNTLLHYDNMLQFINESNLNKLTKENVKIYYTNACLLKLKDIKKDDRKNCINQIRKRRMIQNIKIKNVKQLIKRLILTLNINWYLKIIK